MIAGGHPAVAGFLGVEQDGLRLDGCTGGRGGLLLAQALAWARWAEVFTARTSRDERGEALEHLGVLTETGGVYKGSAQPVH